VWPGEIGKASRTASANLCRNRMRLAGAEQNGQRRGTDGIISVLAQGGALPCLRIGIVNARPNCRPPPSLGYESKVASTTDFANRSKAHLESGYNLGRPRWVCANSSRLRSFSGSPSDIFRAQSVQLQNGSVWSPTPAEAQLAWHQPSESFHRLDAHSPVGDPGLSSSRCPLRVPNGTLLRVYNS